MGQSCVDVGSCGSMWLTGSNWVKMKGIDSWRILCTSLSCSIYVISLCVPLRAPTVQTVPCWLSPTASSGLMWTVRWPGRRLSVRGRGRRNMFRRRNFITQYQTNGGKITTIGWTPLKSFMKKAQSGAISPLFHKELEMCHPDWAKFFHRWSYCSMDQMKNIPEIWLYEQSCAFLSHINHMWRV